MSEKLKYIHKRWFFGAIVAAILLRLFLYPFFFHPDVKIIYYNSSYLSQGVINIYQYLAEKPELAHLGQFVYPPLTYFLFGVFYILIKPFAGSEFIPWLAKGNEAVHTPYIYRYLTLMKLPLLLFDLGTGYLLTRLFKDRNHKKLVFLLWIFNPISLFGTSIIGQFDIIPTFFVVLALVLIKSKKNLSSAFSLGLGAAFKSFPIFLLPIVVLQEKGGWIRKSLIIIFGLLPYLFTIMPFVPTTSFRESVLVSGLSQRLFISSIDIGFEESILIVPLIIVFVYLLSIKNKIFTPIHSMGIVIAVILAFSHFHPQWGIWLAPFLSLWILSNKEVRYEVCLLITAFFGVIFLFPDRFLGPVLFSPISEEFLFLPAFRDYVKILEPELLQSIFHTLMAAAVISILYKLLQKNNHAENS